LYEPLRFAEDYGVKILLEPHDHISDSVNLMGGVLDKCNSSALGINLDTGNLWQTDWSVMRKYKKTET